MCDPFYWYEYELDREYEENQMVDLLFYFYLKNRLTPIDIQFAYQEGFIPEDKFKYIMNMIYDKQQRDFDMFRGK